MLEAGITYRVIATKLAEMGFKRLDGDPIKKSDVGNYVRADWFKCPKRLRLGRGRHSARVYEYRTSKTKRVVEGEDRKIPFLVEAVLVEETLTNKSKVEMLKKYYDIN